MITPRRTRLVRVADLNSFRHAIVHLSSREPGQTNHPLAPVVIVPTRNAARQLARTFDASAPLPPLVTRDELYDHLHARLSHGPRRLTVYERDVMMQAAARGIASEPARSRPGFVAEMLRFYDQLRRHARTVKRFEELLNERLAQDAEYDRGAERMLEQTRFLTAAFRAYEQRVFESAACDEHTLRARLIDDAGEPPADPVRAVLVTVGDWIADQDGLYLADFDLLTRLPGLETLDIVATEGLLASGFHQRIHEWLPGIEEIEAATLNVRPSFVRPRLAVPTGSERSLFVHRDREEELIAIVRRIASDGVSGDRLDRIGVVFKRPLPYLYLAREVFGNERIRYQAADTLPLAAEPFAAALDLVLECVESDFTRAALIGLLRSPHFRFEHEGRPIARDEIAALNRMLSEKRYLGGFDRLMNLEPTAGSTAKGDTLISPALTAARAIAAQLAPLSGAAPASVQLRSLVGFLDGHARPIDEPGPLASRLLRAKGAIAGALESLTAAYAAHDDPPMTIAELSATVRRWIEEQTFLPESRDDGVQLVDDQAARYGDFDELTVVGLVEGEWPERPRRNIFYPSSLINALGWPSEKDRRSAAESRFVDLLCSATRRVAVSTVTLDDEALVEVSTFEEVIPLARLTALPAESGSPPNLYEETPLLDFSAPLPLEPDAERWSEMRRSRSPRDASLFHGQTEAVPPRPWSVSALETYLGCPFKFFAQHVLRLEEEPEDEEVMDPRTQGQFIHEVFEAFFKRWHDSGYQAITVDNLETARAIFTEVVDEQLAVLSITEAGLERTRLLGSAAAAGLGEAVLRMEAERPVGVVARLLEHRLEGEFAWETETGRHVVSLRGKADRVDLLADGTFRVIDYKLGWPPNKARALQLPIYGLCAEQLLDGHLGRHWTLGEAAYLAFKGPKRVVPLFTSPADRDSVLAAARERLVATVDAISRGEFPPRPDDVHRCETCSYDAVCRKDYVGDV